MTFAIIALQRTACMGGVLAFGPGLGAAGAGGGSGADLSRIYGI